MNKLVTEVFQTIISDQSYKKYHERLKQYLIDRDEDMFVAIPSNEITLAECHKITELLDQYYTTEDCIFVSQTLYAKYKKGELK